jgi:tetratricopeptide (TPR) repeat protein
VASAQLEAIRERGPHTLYGDIRVETEPGDDSAKPLSLEIQLYIINGTLIGRQNVAANGRYRFMDLANGEYDVVVMSENLEVARVRVRVQSVYKTDFRQDITLEARTNHKANKPATISASDVYERTSANKSLFAKAQKAVDEKKYDEAMDLFSRLVAVDPKDFQAWTELGTVQLMRKNVDEAEKAYRRAIEERPAFTLALLNLGRLLSAENKFDAAIVPLTEAVKASPASADANFLLGEAYLQIKKGSKAVPYLNEAARLGKPDAHLRLATLYNAVGMKDRAALEYEQFLKKRPEYKDRKALEQYISENKKP